MNYFEQICKLVSRFGTNVLFSHSSDKEMEMIAHKSPGINVEGIFFVKILQTVKKITTILSGSEYLYSINSPAHNMM